MKNFIKVILIFSLLTPVVQADSPWMHVEAKCAARMDSDYLAKGNLEEEWGGARQWRLLKMVTDYQAAVDKKSADTCLSLALPQAVEDAEDWNFYHGNYTGCNQRYVLNLPKEEIQQHCTDLGKDLKTCKAELKQYAANCTDQSYSAYKENTEYIGGIDAFVQKYQIAQATQRVNRYEKAAGLEADAKCNGEHCKDQQPVGNVKAIEEGLDAAKPKEPDVAKEAAVADKDQSKKGTEEEKQIESPPLPPAVAAAAKTTNDKPAATPNEDSEEEESDELGGGEDADVAPLQNPATVPAETAKKMKEDTGKIEDKHQTALEKICSDLDIPINMRRDYKGSQPDSLGASGCFDVLNESNERTYDMTQDSEVLGRSISIDKSKVEFIRRLRNADEYAYVISKQTGLDEPILANECFNEYGKSYVECFHTVNHIENSASEWGYGTAGGIGSLWLSSTAFRAYKAKRAAKAMLGVGGTVVEEVVKKGGRRIPGFGKALEFVKSKTKGTDFFKAIKEYGVRWFKKKAPVATQASTAAEQAVPAATQAVKKAVENRPKVQRKVPRESKKPKQNSPPRDEDHDHEPSNN